MTHRIAIIGSGISGLSAAYYLNKHPDVEVTLFEANDYFGGHTHTVDIEGETSHGMQSYPVDTGFLVFNERTYPKLISLFKELSIPTAYSDMSFSVQAPRTSTSTLEWSGSSLNTVFAQRKNVLSPSFLAMLKDILRFNRMTTQLAQAPHSLEMEVPLNDFLKHHQFNSQFINWYLLPMLGCIWSCPPDQMLAFPLATMIRFCHNHGLLQVTNRPKWFTVAGGAKQYVSAIVSQLKRAYLNTPVLGIKRNANSIIITSSRGEEEFERLIISTHADQALKMLDAPTNEESSMLGAFKFKDNIAVLHKDEKILPSKKLAWAAWNFESSNLLSASQDVQQSKENGGGSVCLHYYLNKLQPTPFIEPIVVSLNPIRDIDPSKITATFNYSHPIFDLSTVKAQNQIHTIQGSLNTWYAGAWLGYGFHEDGLKSGEAAAKSVLASLFTPGINA
jgi:predicted NAD/FAD-binding protein